MRRHIAFLRGMNLGHRRISNDDLCARFRAMGFSNVSAFLASGNVNFDVPRNASAEFAAHVEEGLRSSLGYEVPTFPRTADEVRAIAGHEVFSEELERSGGKVQVALLRGEPPNAARETVLNLATEEDRLAIHGRELFWLPRGNTSQSGLDLALIEAALGPMTVRTKRTLERIVARYLNA